MDDQGLEPRRPGKRPLRQCSSAATMGRDYDVFLNHRGPDVKAGFVAHLFEALRTVGLNPFLDKACLKMGDRAFGCIEDALAESKVHVAVISKGYAESKYCLSELVAMMRSGKPVIPVFYDVEPLEVRWVESGPFAEAFEKHKVHRSAEQVEEWRDALGKVAEITGFCFRLSDYKGDEVQLKWDVVDAVLGMIPAKEELDVGHHLVGVEEPVTTCINKLEMMSGATCILGLVGMGGVGKTTLAKEIYNRFGGTKRFQAMSFLEIDSHSSSSMEVGQSLVSRLQEQLLWGLLQVPHNNQQRYSYWFRRLSRLGPVLVVLDGLDERSQFDEVILDKSLLASGSCIIVTSRDGQVLKVIGGESNFHLHEVAPLGCDDAQKLFNLCAFGKEEALEKFKAIAMDVSKECGGLPLVLKVVGSRLFNKKSDEDLECVWPEAMDALKKEKSVMNVLQWSYDCLSKEEKVDALKKEKSVVNVLQWSYDCLSKEEKYESSANEGQIHSNSTFTLDNSFPDILYNELQQVDNITEVHSDYEDLQSLFQNGEDETIILCCYDATNAHFEFYFRSSEEMANVVGVGMQYAKVVLVDGWKIIVYEQLEPVWKQSLGRVRSNSAIVYKSLKLLQSNVTLSKEFEGYPLLYTIAKYFIFKEALTIVTMTNNNDVSTSKGNSTQIHGAGNDGTSRLDKIVQRIIRNRERKQEDEDKDGENTCNGRDHIDPKEAMDGKPQTIVSIIFLGGGEVHQAVAKTYDKNRKEVSGKQCRYKPRSEGKLKLLKQMIRPDLEILFLNEGEIKQIQCTVGTVSFDMDSEGVWLHDGWRVIFGLDEAYQHCADVDRRSFKALDVTDRKMTSNESIGSGGSEELALSTSFRGGVKVSMFNASLSTQATNKKSENGTRQSSFGDESSISITSGGLRIEGHEREKQLECLYYNLEGPYSFVDYRKTHAARIDQDVKFQGRFTILENSELPLLQFAKYKLTASRYLKEVEQEPTSSVLENSAPGLSEMRPAEDEVLETIYNQKCEKTILINHSMSHLDLDGKHHKLKEAEQGGNTTFTKVNGRKFVWSNDPLVKPTTS